MRRFHREDHSIARIGWLRAAVLGANDGILSTASLIAGVAAAGQPRADVLVAGAAGLVAGAMSMAAGEFVSVSSQADTERADLAREAGELDADPQAEHEELAGIYRSRGLPSDLAHQVAEQLMRTDALGAHARDELGITDTGAARPLQAAAASALTFAVGAALPLCAALIAPRPALGAVVSAVSIAALVGLGALGARAGGAPMAKAAARVGFWGAAAMALTSGLGALLHVAL